MGIEENKEVVRRFLAGVRDNDIAALNETMADNSVIHAAVGVDLNKEASKQGTTSIHISFSDISITIEDIVAEGDKVSTRLTLTGKHTGKYQNINPTGSTFSVSRFIIFHLDDRKITEAWYLTDMLSIYQQLGALPPSEEIGK